MSLIKVKCPFCGEVFSTELTNPTTICNKCNKDFSTQKGSKYYKSIHKIETEQNIIAKGEEYVKVDNLLVQGDFYLKNGDFAMAEEVYNKALTLSNVDYRIYLGLVYAKTCNFTDLEDQTHFEYLQKAIEYANNEQKQHVKKLYSPYHTQRKIPKEEREEYLKQEENSKFKKLESYLKDGIPKHFKLEKTIKTCIILAPIFLALSVLFLVLDLTINHFAFSIIAILFFCACVFFMLCYLSGKNKCKLYNLALDLFDNYKLFEIQPKDSLVILKRYNEFTLAYLNDSIDTTLKNSMQDVAILLANLNNSKINEFISNNKTLSDLLK